MSARTVITLLAAVVLALTLTPDPLLAYGGPGSVISGIGALLAAVAAIGAAVFGFVWFPLKRLLRRIRGGDEGAGAPDDEAGEDLARE